MPSANAAISARTSENWPSSGIMLFLRLLELPRRADRMSGLAQRFGRFRRHVVLVVLREHLGRDEVAVVADMALRDDAAALLEHVRQDAAVADRNRLRAVGDDEGD